MTNQVPAVPTAPPAEAPALPAIADVAPSLASLRAQDQALQQATPVVATSQAPFPPFSPPPFDPDNATAIIIVFFLAVLMPISLAFARRIWRRSPKETPEARSDMISPRLDRLEQAVDAVAIEIERIAEGQRFLTKVFGSGAGLAARDAGLARGNDASAHSDAAPHAIGAGPIEPIRAAERQPVRPAITPR